VQNAPMLERYYEDFSRWLVRAEGDAVLDHVAEQADAPALAVYRNGFLRTCMDALKGNYPTVLSVVGADYFHVVALRYIELFPPRRRTLIGYGDEFPEFLADSESRHGLGYLPDLARVDRAWLNVFLAKEEPALDQKSLDGILTSSIGITDIAPGLRATAAAVQCGHRCGGLWRSLREVGEIDAVTLEREPETILIWRLRNRIEIRELNRAEGEFAAAIVAGETLGAAAEKAIAVDADFDVATTFAAWLENKILLLPEN